MPETIEFQNVMYYYEEPDKPVFSNLSASLPGGVTSLVGQNGSGKSTLLLLAGGRFLPRSGRVLIDGIDTAGIKDEEERNRIASFVYQNMEFETEESIGDLLQLVFQSGNHHNENASLVNDLIREFELEAILDRPFHKTSKGEMQKINIAFSLLYGSKILIMDEPVFALENIWKDRILGFLHEYVKENEMNLYYSIHELDLSRKYSDNAVLFFKNGSISVGPTDAVLKKENVEEAYQVPLELLYQREELFRDHLLHPASPENLAGRNVKVVEE